MAELNHLIQSRGALHRHDLEHIEALACELDRAGVVTAATLAPDVVTMRSRVRVRDLGTGEGDIYTIVSPMNADVAAGRVSVLAPMGTGLPGVSSGRRRGVADARRETATPGGGNLVPT